MALVWELPSGRPAAVPLPSPLGALGPVGQALRGQVDKVLVNLGGRPAPAALRCAPFTSTPLLQLYRTIAGAKACAIPAPHTPGPRFALTVSPYPLPPPAPQTPTMRT